MLTLPLSAKHPDQFGYFYEVAYFGSCTVEQWLAREIHNLEAVGSSPTRATCRPPSATVFSTWTLTRLETLGRLRSLGEG